MATQVRRPWRTTARTVFQAIVGVAAATPVIYAAAAQESPELATGAAAIVVGGAGVITRVMALPQVEDLLQRFVPWLAADPGGDS